MITPLIQRGVAFLSKISMYRSVLYALAILAVLAIALSSFGAIGPRPLEILLSFLAVGVGVFLGDLLGHKMVRTRLRWESLAITTLILGFIVFPGSSIETLAPLAGAGFVAGLSKFVLVWKGRHIFNPAAFGATVLTLTGLGSAAWWIGTPALAIPVIVLGLAVVWRTEKFRLIAVFLVIAGLVNVVRLTAQTQGSGASFAIMDVLSFTYIQSPFLFLALFMLTEPLTLPPRRYQQFIVAAVAGVLAGWPIHIGVVSLGADRALLIANLVAFVFATKTAVKLSVESARDVTPRVREVTFRASHGWSFSPGQYLEIEVPHRKPDTRGTRREFSIVSMPSELPTVRIAYRKPPAENGSSYKRELERYTGGERVRATGVWGDFVLPKKQGQPLVLIAAGIGVTPFVSQLSDAASREADRDVVLVYVASASEDLAYREELESCGVRVVVFTRDQPSELRHGWSWANGVRLDADGLVSVVPDLGERHAYISGPPSLIAELSPALRKAKTLTTDAFAGY